MKSLMFTTMKKTYIIPEMQLTLIASETTLLEGSMVVDGNTTVQGDNGGWVKENRQDYNVWDDDWSQN